MSGLQGLPTLLNSTVRRCLAIPGGFAPARFWPELDTRIPVSSMAVPSALLAFFLGFGIGIPGFLAYAEQVGRVVSGAMLTAGSLEGAGRKPAGSTVVIHQVSIFSLLGFALFTPTGLLASYLVTSGTFRLLACAAGQPHGDPLLTGLYAGLVGARERVSHDRMAADREHAEGPAEPDVLLPGREAGMPEAEYVIVSARRKPGWDRGTFVVTSGARYKLGSSFDRRFPGGLRTLYPLTEAAALEVLRRSVHYELPRLSTLDPVTRETRLAPPRTGDTTPD